MEDGSTELVPAHISIMGEAGNTLQAQAADGVVVYRQPRLRPDIGRRMGSATLDAVLAIATGPLFGTLDDRVPNALSYDV